MAFSSRKWLLLQLWPQTKNNLALGALDLTDEYHRFYGYIQDNLVLFSSWKGIMTTNNIVKICLNFTQNTRVEQISQNRAMRYSNFNNAISRYWKCDICDIQILRKVKKIKEKIYVFWYFECICLFWNIKDYVDILIICNLFKV